MLFTPLTKNLFVCDVRAYIVCMFLPFVVNKDEYILKVISVCGVFARTHPQLAFRDHVNRLS